MTQVYRNYIDFVIEQFRLHYKKMSNAISGPTDIKEREFGFLFFNEKMMMRHTGFDQVKELQRFLVKNAPAHVYHSSAYYLTPEAEMEWKGWKGADLVFDIDADHIYTLCKNKHDRWRCRSCTKEGFGRAPEQCPVCGNVTFNEEKWVCDDCLRTAKVEAQKLLDFLIHDFGFSPSEVVQINFSGNRGYHVHIRSPRVQPLNQNERREVVDYVMGIGLKPEYHGFRSRIKGSTTTIADVGWRGRVARSIYDYISNLSLECVEKLNVSKTTGLRLIKEKDKILSLLRESHPNSILQFVNVETLGRIMEEAKMFQASSIDTVVTTDIHRLIRLPNTLHGKTGWLAQTIPINLIEDYDPLVSAIAFFEGTVKLEITWAPRFRILDETYGPFSNEIVEMPLAAAIYLLLKNAARLR